MENTEVKIKIFKPLDLNKSGNHTLSERLTQYLANVFLMCCALLLFCCNKYYNQLLQPTALLIIKYYILGYSVIGYIAYVFFLKKLKAETRGYLFLRAFEKLIRHGLFYLKNFMNYKKSEKSIVDVEEKNALLFILVKLFYLPIMASFCLGNFTTSVDLFSQINTNPNFEFFNIRAFNDIIYPLLFNLFLFTDVLIFMFGYMFEADFLKNKIRSVEPTVLGWMVAILCYPPFNNVLGNYVDWYASDNPVGSNDIYTFVLRVIILALFAIYLWASFALGTKASNLTNRGIVENGPYAFVRHPAYISKNLAWWISMIPVISLNAVLGMSVWTFIYFLRAVTEERHLIMDPDYQKYCSKVKYRFIPHVY